TYGGGYRNTVTTYKAPADRTETLWGGLITVVKLSRKIRKFQYHPCPDDLNPTTPILLLVLIAPLIAAAQIEDSLTALLERPELSDTLKVNVLNKLAWELKHKSPENALHYATEAIALAK